MLHRSNASHESLLLSMEIFLGLQVAKDKGTEEEARSAKRLVGLGSQQPGNRRKRGRKPQNSPRNG